MASAAKKTKLSSCHINELSDNDLSEIFQHLPPYDRLIISEVCRRWHEISRKAWLDITNLDLSPVPEASIAAVANLCPKLESISCAYKSFHLNQLSRLCKVPTISSLRFCGCKFEVDSAVPDRTHNIFAKIFSDQLEQTSTELVLHDAHFWQAGASNIPRPRWCFDASFLPISLTHLQLSGLYITQPVTHIARLFLHGLERLQNLECFILHTTPVPLGEFDFINSSLHSLQVDIFKKIDCLVNLKELCVGPATFHNSEFNIPNLPKLEVLFLNNVDNINLFHYDDFCKWITSSSLLRILVLSGKFIVDLLDDNDVDDHQVLLPARRRYPNGFGADPLPLLHIFVGREASENIIFETSPSDATIHPITEPMPLFLEREDIAPIFEGVWVAEKIKEAAENGAQLWDYWQCDNATWTQYRESDH